MFFANYNKEVGFFERCKLQTFNGFVNYIHCQMASNKVGCPLIALSQNEKKCNFGSKWKKCTLLYENDSYNFSGLKNKGKN